MAITNAMKEQGEKTRQAILDAGLKLWPDVTPSTVANKLNITHATVLYHFSDVKNAVGEYAVEKGYSPVIVQMLASGHKLVRNMNANDRLKHFTNVVKS